MMPTARDSLLIRNARIVDGTGGPSQTGDVAVRRRAHRGRRRATCRRSGLPAGAREIDARGQVLAPGFIDVHTHFDPQICWDRLATPSLEHGVTTVLMGNCSLSLAPVKPARPARARRHVQADRGHPARTFDAGVPWTLGELSRVPRLHPPGPRASTSPGWSATRRCAPTSWARAAQERAATEDEIAAMCAHPAGRDPRRRRRALDLVRRHRRADAAGAEPLGDARRDHRARPGHARGRPRPHPDRAGLLQPARAAAEHPTTWARSRAPPGSMCTVAPIVHSAATTLWKDSLDALDAEAARGARVFGQSMPRTFDINIRLSETLVPALRAAGVGGDHAPCRCPSGWPASRDPARRDELRNQSMLLGPLLYVLTVGQTARPENARAARAATLTELAAERGVDAGRRDARPRRATRTCKTEFSMRNVIHADPDGRHRDPDRIRASTSAPATPARTSPSSAAPATPATCWRAGCAS